MLGDTRIWTMDLSDCSRLLYHWAISPYVENIVSSEERQVGVTCQNCQSPLAVETKSKCHHYRSTNCISEHLKRRWYNGQHSCLPSSWSGFDSRPTQLFSSAHFYWERKLWSELIENNSSHDDYRMQISYNFKINIFDDLDFKRKRWITEKSSEMMTMFW